LEYSWFTDEHPTKYPPIGDLAAAHPSRDIRES
jgi:hypothetical protein